MKRNIKREEIVCRWLGLIDWHAKRWPLWPASQPSQSLSLIYFICLATDNKIKEKETALRLRSY